jgi:hypothetical protein
MKQADLKLLKRFGGAPDRYGIGIVVIDLDTENIAKLLEAAREEGRQEIRNNVRKA